MRLTFLGTGTSCGVPVLGCQCEVCTSKDPRDARLRAAALLETSTTRLLIDCGPDIRQQLLRVPFKKIDGVLLTHIHYDHVGGIDDLRPYCKFGDINIYCNKATADGLRRTMPYCFGEHLYPGVPQLKINVINAHEHFCIGDMDVMPVEVLHDQLPILAYRIGSFAYVTDMKSISEIDRNLLQGVDTVVVNALRWEKVHHSHMLVDDALDFVRSIGANRTYLIHMDHLIGLHSKSSLRLPNGVSLAYDGLEVEV